MYIKVMYNDLHLFQVKNILKAFTYKCFLIFLFLRVSTYDISS